MGCSERLAILGLVGAVSACSGGDLTDKELVAQEEVGTGVQPILVDGSSTAEAVVKDRLWVYFGDMYVNDVKAYQDYMEASACVTGPNSVGHCISIGEHKYKKEDWMRWGDVNFVDLEVERKVGACFTVEIKVRKTKGFKESRTWTNSYCWDYLKHDWYNGSFAIDGERSTTMSNKFSVNAWFKPTWQGTVAKGVIYNANPWHQFPAIPTTWPSLNYIAYELWPNPPHAATPAGDSDLFMNRAIISPDQRYGTADCYSTNYPTQNGTGLGAGVERCIVEKATKAQAGVFGYDAVYGDVMLPNYYELRIRQSAGI